MIEYINETHCRIPKAEINRFVGFLYNYFNISHKLLLEIVFLDSVAIRRINYIYRQKNKPTDVLSFPVKNFHSTLGSIILCPEIIKLQDKKYNYLAYISHGFLHLMGKDHECDQDEKKWQELINLIDCTYAQYKKIKK